MIVSCAARCAIASPLISGGLCLAENRYDIKKHTDKLMFEKQFEFEVPFPIEICEERIDKLRMTGCLLRLAQPIRTSILHSKPKVFTEFYVRQTLGRNSGKIEIDGYLEAIDKGSTLVVGTARLKNIWFTLIFFNVIFLSLIFGGIHDRVWFTTGWGLAMGILWWLQISSSNKRLINILEKALTKVEKKKRA